MAEPDEEGDKKCHPRHMENFCPTSKSQEVGLQCGITHLFILILFKRYRLPIAIIEPRVNMLIILYFTGITNDLNHKGAPECNLIAPKWCGEDEPCFVGKSETVT